MRLNVTRLKFHFSIICLAINLTCYGFSHRELITNLHSKIIVNSDASLTITETIKINAQHDQIRRGITRSFPTNYRNKMGANVVVDFEVQRVLLDGQTCPYQMAKAQNGKILLLGNDQFISKGEHTYQITYQTNRQLTFTKDWTELYFNVVGSDVVFPILKASADIYLPTNIDSNKIELYGYTGYYGQKNKNYRAQIYPTNVCHFETTKELQPKQSFTISVAFPAGMGGLTAPNGWTIFKWIVRDNLSVIILLLCILFLLLIYLYASYQIQQDQPVIIPLFAPPINTLPADCAFLYDKRFNNTALTATIVDMAVHGYLKIKYHPTSLLKSAYHSLIKNQEQPTDINPKYTHLSEILFDKKDELKLDKSHYAIFNKFVSRLKFNTSTNSKHIESCENTILAGVIVSIISILGALYYQPSEGLSFFILLIIGINAVAIHNLKRHTASGQKLYAQIAGFRMFLNYTEKDRIARLNPPTITCEMFEKYLPYAIALGVDYAWTNHFNKIYAHMIESNYQPNWFVGHRFHLKNFNRDIQSFSSALNNAITAPLSPPGTSSGRGGGGFSGGGGGGGGIGGR